MKIKNYQEAVEKLYDYLPEYLEDQGIDITKNFGCISPTHNDSNPSMGLAPSKKAFHCFGCGFSGGIFNAAHILEDKPLNGPEFVQENLNYLAEKFGVHLESEPLTEEEIYELETYRAYKTASDIIVNGKKSDQFQKAIKERGWSVDVCKNYGIGSVTDYKEFREQLKKAGYSAGFLDDIDLNRKDIFSDDRMIFTIRDEYARPVGFASRNLSFDGDKKNGAKYVNQRGTGVKCNIYKKSERLFGFDRYLEKREKSQAPIYLFEGYGDVTTAADSGIWNTCAIGGTSLTVEQIQLIKAYNCYEIILCLDGDDAGQKRTAEILDSVLGNHKDLKISIVIIPGEMDPDEFIKTNGVEKFKELRKWSAFEWRIAQFDDSATSEEICESMIPLIVNESNYVYQETMCNVLSKTTGFTLKTIQQEVNRLQNVRDNERSRDKKEVIDRLIYRLQREPGEAENVIRESEIELHDLAKKYNNDAFSEESTLALVQGQKAFQEEKDGSFSGFLLGPDLIGLQNALSGNWIKDVWLTLGGKPNCGKTSFLVKTIFSIASIEENNACVIYHSIDDTAEQVLPKFITVAEGSKKLTLNQVDDPNYYENNKLGQDVRYKRDTGYSVVTNLIRQGRLVVKDANSGSSFAYAESLIRYYKERYPDRNIVYVLDNFHKVSDFKSIKDERVRFKELSKVIKNIATRNHICAISTIEYKKIEHGKQANNSDIGETAQIEYDANLIAHVHNEVHEKGEAAIHCHEHNFEDGTGNKLCPRIQVNIGKNKISGFKNTLWFDFYPDSSDFTYIPDKKVALDAQKRKNETTAEQEGMILKYIEIKELVENKGWSKGKIFYEFMDTMDLDPGNQDDKKVFYDIQKKAEKRVAS